MDEEYYINRCEDLDCLIFKILERIKPDDVTKSTILALWNAAGEPEDKVMAMYPPEQHPGLAGALVVRDWGGVFRYFQAEQFKAS